MSAAVAAAAVVDVKTVTAKAAEPPPPPSLLLLYPQPPSTPPPKLVPQLPPLVRQPKTAPRLDDDNGSELLRVFRYHLFPPLRPGKGTVTLNGGGGVIELEVGDFIITQNKLKLAEDYTRGRYPSFRIIGRVFNLTDGVVRICFEYKALSRLMERKRAGSKRKDGDEEDSNTRPSKRARMETVAEEAKESDAMKSVNALLRDVSCGWSPDGITPTCVLDKHARHLTVTAVGYDRIDGDHVDRFQSELLRCCSFFGVVSSPHFDVQLDFKAKSIGARVHFDSLRALAP